MRRSWIAFASVAFGLILPLMPIAPASAASAGDRAVAAGVYDKTQTWAVRAVDFDQDGDEDIWIGFHQHSGKLYSNDGDGTYTRVAANAFPRQNAQGGVPDRHDCAWGDVDQNGLMDAYCTTGRNQSNYVKGANRDNELWLQTSIGVFSEVGSQWGVGDWCGRGRHVTFLDANGDQWPDLFLGNEVPRNVSDPCDNPANGYPNEESKLLINTGGTGFRYAPEYLRFGSGPGQRCAVTLDFNADGWDDILACRLKGQPPRLYRNNAGSSFTEVSYARGLRTAAADADPVDLDLDGDTDLVFAGRGEFYYQSNNNGTFATKVRIRAITGGEGRSVAAGDCDGDGDIDVYGLTRADNRTNPADYVMLRSGSNWTSLTVPGAVGDGDAVAAVRPLPTSQTVQFLVLNGGNDSEAGAAGGGPVQLIAVAP